MQLRTSVQKKLDMAKVLLSQGASANGFNKRGESPFHLAVLSGCEELTILLVQLGGDVNLKSQCDEETVLHIAARKGYVSLIHLFLQYGACVNLRSKVRTKGI
jgi:ankyrin repeat protein